LVLGALILAVLVASVLRRVLNLEPSLIAGVFTGAFTNTPALAGVLEALKGTSAESLPVLGYSVAYPMGVIAMLLCIGLLERFWKVDMPLESARVAGFSSKGLKSVSVRIENPDLVGQAVVKLAQAEHWNVLFARHRRGEVETLVSPETILELGDMITLIGSEKAVENSVVRLGEEIPAALELDRSHFDYRRVFVSNSVIAGRTLLELQLPQRFGALITRVRRGDVEFLPNKDTVLELGDRVRVVCARQQMEAISSYLGDSYQHLSEIDVLSFGLGIALGLLLGTIKIPLPTGGHFELGIAGGTLIVGLLLGWRERFLGVLWQIPYSANLTLRQIGIVLFLAGVGTRSGFAFGQTVFSSLGITLFLLGAFLTAFISIIFLIVTNKMLRIPFPIAIGMLAGLQTQPAVLAFATERSGNDLPNQGYATVYPLAMIAKILLAQLLLTL
jgi:putative transport protein